MNKNNFYIFFGFWIAILPFSGLPSSWRNGLLFASGILIMLITIGPSIMEDLTKKKVVKKSQKTSLIEINSNISNSKSNEEEVFVSSEAEDLYTGTKNDKEDE